MTLNIGWLSASPAATTGYGTQSMEICDRLLERHKVTCIGQTGEVIVWGGRQTVATPTKKSLTVLPLADPRSAEAIINNYYIPEFEMEKIALRVKVQLLQQSHNRQDATWRPTISITRRYCRIPVN